MAESVWLVGWENKYDSNYKGICASFHLCKAAAQAVCDDRNKPGSTVNYFPVEYRRVDPAPATPAPAPEAKRSLWVVGDSNNLAIRKSDITGWRTIIHPHMDWTAVEVFWRGEWIRMFTFSGPNRKALAEIKMTELTAE